MESFECQANRSGLDGVGMLYHRRFSPSEYHDQSLLFYAVFNLVFEPQVQIAYCISFNLHIASHLIVQVLPGGPKCHSHFTDDTVDVQRVEFPQVYQLSTVSTRALIPVCPNFSTTR